VHGDVALSFYVLSRSELASLALEIINRVKRANERTGKRVSGKFRSRIRELFSMCNYIGIRQVTAFTYAKAAGKNMSGVKSVENALRFLEGQEHAINEMKDEALSYSLFEASILYYLKKIRINIDINSLESVLNLTEKYEFLITPFLSWLKLMAEAELMPER
jgi:CRISPR type III-B/RAMP module-associated protein Cmr5